MGTFPHHRRALHDLSRRRGFRELPWCAHGRRRRQWSTDFYSLYFLPQDANVCAPTPSRRSAHP